MEHQISYYLKEVEDYLVVARCDHLLFDLLVIFICTYMTCGTTYQDMYLFGKERGEELKGRLLEFSDGDSSADTF